MVDDRVRDQDSSDQRQPGRLPHKSSELRIIVGHASRVPSRMLPAHTIVAGPARRHRPLWLSQSLPLKPAPDPEYCR